MGTVDPFQILRGCTEIQLHPTTTSCTCHWDMKSLIGPDHVRLEAGSSTMTGTGAVTM